MFAIPGRAWRTGRECIRNNLYLALNDYTRTDLRIIAELPNDYSVHVHPLFIPLKYFSGVGIKFSSGSSGIRNIKHVYLHAAPER